MKCFRKNGYRKWTNRFKIEKLVVLAEYFEQQTDCSRYRRKISQSKLTKKVLCRSIIRIYFFLSNKCKSCHGAINSWPPNLRTTLAKDLWFHWNCKQLRVEARNSMSNCEIYFAVFSETVHIILKIYSQEGLRKCR